MNSFRSYVESRRISLASRERYSSLSRECKIGVLPVPRDDVVSPVRLHVRHLAFSSLSYEEETRDRVEIIGIPSWKLLLIKQCAWKSVYARGDARGNDTHGET